MCGRFALTHSWQEMVEWYNLILPVLTGEAVPPPRYNIAPTQPIMMVQDGARGRINLLVRWGLVPSWVKDPGDFSLLINARAETAVQKPSFRNAMRHRRTLIPASGFYEWRRTDKSSQPFWIRPRDSGLLTFAGLMETWSGPDGSEIDTGCILTIEANNTIAKVHHRMPVIISPDDFDRWLDCKNSEPKDMADLLTPANDQLLEAIPVSTKVNKVANAGADIQLPVTDIEAEENADDEFDNDKPDNDQFSMF